MFNIQHLLSSLLSPTAAMGRDEWRGASPDLFTHPNAFTSTSGWDSEEKGLFECQVCTILFLASHELKVLVVFGNKRYSTWSFLNSHIKIPKKKKKNSPNQEFTSDWWDSAKKGLFECQDCTILFLTSHELKVMIVLETKDTVLDHFCRILKQN